MSKPSARPSKIKVQEKPFDLDAIEKEGSDKAFHFTLDGRDFSMTPLGRIDRKKVKKIRTATEDASEVESMEMMLQVALGDDQWAKFDELPLSMEGLKELFQAWTEHSGIEVPESSASSDS